MAETKGLLTFVSFAFLSAARRRTASRAAYFSALVPLFDRSVIQTQPTGFPRMTAHLGPHAFDLQALPDSLTFRKLPCLWLLLTLPEPMPVAATLDIMARPTGHETFSHHATLPHRLPVPASLPEGIAIHSDNAALAPRIPRQAAIFADQAVKELLITPKGLRLVILAEEADRGRYLIFRDAELGANPLPDTRVAPLLETLIALKSDLIAKAAE